MRWIACLLRVVMVLCVGIVAAAPSMPASAHAPAPSTGVNAHGAVAKPTTLTAAAPMTLTLTAADNGGTVQVGAGGDVLVELPGNPSTGYGWQVSANDDSILLPIATWFEPDTDLVGSPGLAKFSFHAMAPGAVGLHLIYTHLSNMDTPPDQTFSVTVEAMDQAAPTAPVTVGSADSGKTVALLPGQLMNVALEGDSTGMWYITDGDPMIVQQLGDWVVTPLNGNPAHSLFTRTFIGVQAGTATLSVGFSTPDQELLDPVFGVTVVVPPVQPGNSTAVVAIDYENKAVALATGDMLVVRLRPFQPTYPFWNGWAAIPSEAALPQAEGSPECIRSSEWGTDYYSICTYRFLARLADQGYLAMGVYLCHVKPCSVIPTLVVSYHVTIMDPAPLTGNTVAATAAQAGRTIHLARGDKLDVALDPSAGATWLVMVHDPALVRTLPSEAPPLAPAGAAPDVQHLSFQAVGVGQSELAIGLFPKDISTPVQTFTATIAADWPHQYLPKVSGP